jgi:hypothetical protein
MMQPEIFDDIASSLLSTTHATPLECCFILENGLRFLAFIPLVPDRGELQSKRQDEKEFKH